MKRLIIVCLLIASFDARSREDPVIQAMRDEMQRSIQKLHLEKLDRPYFISYRIVDTESKEISATLGSLLGNSENRGRLLTVNVRVGDYSFDNSNFLSLGSGGAGFAAQMLAGVAVMPLDDNYNELRRQIWLATDGAYKKALEDISGKRAALQNKNREDDIPDFSKAAPVSITDLPARVDVDWQEAVRLTRSASEALRQSPSIQASLVHFSAENRLERYLNSEGGAFTRLIPRVSVRITASTQASDGMVLGDFVSAYGYSVKDLPSEAQFRSQILNLAAELSALQAAPHADRYNGPVLFEGQAAAEVFARNFAEALPAQPATISNNAQLEEALRQPSSGLLNKMGARVLPEFIDVVDDPTAIREKDSLLFGGYKVDEEGVPANRTLLVRDGILKTVLSSRAPVRGVPQSTGNLRERGVAATNLFVNAGKTLSLDELHKRLVELAVKRGNRYGIVVRRLSGRNATLAYRVYVDGHEELVRNAELSGMSVANFKDIVAVSDQRFVYTEATPQRNASLSMVPQIASAPLESYVVPAMLFDDVTIQKTPGNSLKPPVANNPLSEYGSD
jgi:predicted Zn-dependent protease